MIDDATQPVDPAAVRVIVETARKFAAFLAASRGGQSIPVTRLANLCEALLAENKRLAILASDRTQLEISVNGDAVFIDGTGEVPLVDVESLRAERDRLRALDNEWLLAARKAIADQFDGGWTANASGGYDPPENDPHDLYELCRGRGWSDTPEPVAKMLCDQRDQLAVENESLRARVAELEAGLRPFAEYGLGLMPRTQGCLILDPLHLWEGYATADDCRRAAALLAPNPEVPK